MFSQEQIKEIQYKLGLLGMKDTAFPVATSLDGNETLTIVQDSINKKTYLKDIFNYVPIFNTDLVTKNSLKTVNGQSLLGKGDINLSNLDTTIPYVVVKIEAGAGSVIAGNIVDVRDAKSNNKPCLAYVYNLDETYGMMGSFHLCSIQNINPTTTITNLIYHTELGTTHKTVLLSVSGNGRVTIATDEHIYTTSDELNNAIQTRQAKLFSGKNIKTINGYSLLGSGNIEIQGGSGGISEIPVATNTTLGGLMLGFTQTGKKYPVQLSNKKAYVEVPWENTTYTFTPTNPTLSWGNTSVLGKVGDLEFKATMPANPFPYTLGYTQSGKNYPVLQSGNKLYVNVPWTDNNTTYTKATTAKDGLMSKEDKAKLDTYNPTLYTLKKTQAEYNALESAGTLDANTIYFIVG